MLGFGTSVFVAGACCICVDDLGLHAQPQSLLPAVSVPSPFLCLSASHPLCVCVSAISLHACVWGSVLLLCLLSLCMHACGALCCCWCVCCLGMQVGVLRRYGVTLPLSLSAPRTPIVEAPAVYLVSNSEAAIKKIIQDMQNRLYAFYYLNFISGVDDSLLRQLAEGAAKAVSPNPRP